MGVRCGTEVDDENRRGGGGVQWLQLSTEIGPAKAPFQTGQMFRILKLKSDSDFSPKISFRVQIGVVQIDYAKSESRLSSPST